MADNIISSWESKGLSNEKIGSTKTSSYDQSPGLVYDNARIKLRFTRSILKQNKVTHNHGPIVNIVYRLTPGTRSNGIVNIYIVYRLSPGTRSNSITLKNCLFGAVKLTKNADTDKYKYSGYGIRFDSRGRFSHQVEDMVEMLISLELI